MRSLQEFLKTFEGNSSLKITGTYDAATIAAVNAFQEKYAKDVLVPIKEVRGTSNVLLYTANKINQIYCKSYKPAATPTIAACPVLKAPSAVLPRTITARGTRGDDITILQKFLNTNNLIVSSIGGGTPGNETAFFGPETSAAIGRFQVLCGLTKTSILDEATRKKINDLLDKPVPTETPKLCAPLLTKSLYANRSTNDTAEIRKLQTFLAGQGYDLEINGKYDNLTISAVNQFQEKYAADILVPVNETRGTSNVISFTRKKINAIACSGTPKPSVKPVATATSTPKAVSTACFTSNLKEGSKGSEVTKMQDFLKKQGYYPGAVNGSFDKATTTAVKAFQGAYVKEILTPIDETKPTGLWLESSHKQANKLSGCAQ